MDTAVAGGSDVNWGSASEFFAMGGYAFYVWGSFVTAAVCLAVEVALLRGRRRNALALVHGERMRNEATA